MTRSIILAALILFAFNITLMAHAIRFEVDKKSPAVIVQAGFSGTSPLVDAKVEIFAPGSDKAYQTGRADQAGRFAFVPDEIGNWKVTFDDEMGHFDQINVGISEAFFNRKEIAPVIEDTQNQRTHDSLPVIYQIIFGLALIFGLTGLLYGMKARQSLKKQ